MYKQRQICINKLKKFGSDFVSKEVVCLLSYDNPTWYRVMKSGVLPSQIVYKLILGCNLSLIRKYTAEINPNKF